MEHYCRAKHHPGNTRRYVELTARINSKSRMMEYRGVLSGTDRDRALACKEETTESEVIYMTQLESVLRKTYEGLPVTSDAEKTEMDRMYQERERLEGFIQRHRASMKKEEVQGDKNNLEMELAKLEAVAINDKETDVGCALATVESDCNEFRRQHTLQAAKEAAVEIEAVVKEQKKMAQINIRGGSPTHTG